MTVARTWLESYYYNNDYDLAKTYSTPETAAMIDTIKTLIFPDQSNEAIEFKIKNIQCKQIKGDAKAVCTCNYLEQGEAFTEVLNLVQLDGQWLVDARLGNDEDLLLDDDIEKMAEEFEKSLDRLLDK